MRRTAKAGILSIALLGVIAAVALAAAPEGKYKVTATVGDNDFGIDAGTKVKNTYKLKCADDDCDKLKLTRIDPGGTYKSTLTKSGANYSGTEGPYPYPSCPDNDHATFTVDHKFKGSAVEDGVATKISGTAETKIQNCDFASFVDYTIKGKRK